MHTTTIYINKIISILILKEYLWNIFNKQEGFLLNCLNSISILRVQRFIFYFWIIFFIMLLYFNELISIKILILFIIIIIAIWKKKYINILKIIYKFIFKLAINACSTYLINYGNFLNIFNIFFMDDEPFKFLSYLFSLSTSLFTLYIVIKYFRDIYYAPQEQAELIEKLNTTIDKYKNQNIESDNNIFDKLKKEIEEIIKEND